MSFRNISSWCIRNPVPPIVFFIGLLLAGVIAFRGMSVTNNPDIDFPAAIITISQPGAAPSEMETQVTQKIEAAVRGVNGVDEIDSSIRLTNTVDILKAIARGRGPERSMIALGYSGWAPGQLENEIQANGWLSCPADPDIVFDADLELKYDRALAKLGVDLSHLVSYAGRA